MGQHKYKEKLNGVKSNVTVDVEIVKIPLLARLFGKRIYNVEEDQNDKCETQSIIYRGIIYIANQISVRKEQIDD